MGLSYIPQSDCARHVRKLSNTLQDGERDSLHANTHPAFLMSETDPEIEGTQRARTSWIKTSGGTSILTVVSKSYSGTGLMYKTQASSAPRQTLLKY